MFQPGGGTIGGNDHENSFLGIKVGGAILGGKKVGGAVLFGNKVGGMYEGNRVGG